MLKTKFKWKEFKKFVASSSSSYDFRKSTTDEPVLRRKMEAAERLDVPHDLPETS
jgi:hypothetical protein